MSGYFCTSTVTTPMAFLLLPNITTKDIYTTLSDMWIEHAQINVEWQETDLKDFPGEVITKYESIMGTTLATTTDESSPSIETTHSVSIGASNAAVAPTLTIATPGLTVIPIDTLEPTSEMTETVISTPTLTLSSSKPSSGGWQLARRISTLLVVFLVHLCLLY
ncbi:hypothetical protein F5Y11DRAFT_345472 [Daldinia sp. FL1419]|nr:hypothetical protein F5Y11DRAFT_345472 [Daldinia sp. FL1419]